MAKKKGIAHSNECEFYVTLRNTISFMDSKYVIFGRVIRGLRIFKRIEKLSRDNQKPGIICSIIGCGAYQYLTELPTLEYFASMFQSIEQHNAQVSEELVEKGMIT